MEVDDDEDGDDDDLEQGWGNHQWSLPCCLRPCHGDGRTSVQVVILMMMVMVTILMMMKLMRRSGLSSEGI